MSCNVTITNNNMSSRIIFTALAEDGQSAGKGKVIFSRTIPGGSSGVFNVSQPSASIGISAKQYQQDEIIDVDMLTDATIAHCKGVSRITATWNGNRFEVRQQ